MEIKPLGLGYEPGKGNSPADSVLHRALPNALVAKSDELFALARKSSMWTLSFGLACCAIEMISAHMSHHDVDRFGIVTWPSPRQADVMIVSGTVVKKMADPIKLLYEQMPDPKWVIAMGSCATNGGPYYRSYSVVMGVDHLIPVDVYVPGCPPRPEALMYGLMQLQEKIRQDAGNRSASRNPILAVSPPLSPPPADAPTDTPPRNNAPPPANTSAATPSDAPTPSDTSASDTPPGNNAPAATPSDAPTPSDTSASDTPPGNNAPAATPSDAPPGNNAPAATPTADAR